MSKKQVEVLKLIEKNPSITIDKIARIMKVNRSAVQKHIEKLKKKKVLSHKGSTKSGYWEIKQ